MFLQIPKFVLKPPELPISQWSRAYPTDICHHSVIIDWVSPENWHWRRSWGVSDSNEQNGHSTYLLASSNDVPVEKHWSSRYFTLNSHPRKDFDLRWAEIFPQIAQKIIGSPCLKFPLPGSWFHSETLVYRPSPLRRIRFGRIQNEILQSLL